MSAVRLMRREADQWREVARENIDGPDIEDRLMAMVGKIEDDTSVVLFLPRDQILYTDVKLDPQIEPHDQIGAALEGRTPYSQDELEFDWVGDANGTARVAAIAKETLDEAAAFAEARGLTVAGYGSLATADDFPRNPSFGADLGPTEDALAAAPEPDLPEVAAPETKPQTDPQVTFTTARTSSQIPPDSAEPVVRVDDARPVMQVKSKPLPPLDPGRPIEHIAQAPRVRTDIASGTLSGAAASLTPPGPSIKVRQQSFGPRQTLIAFAVAAVLTVGIAAIVWSILPLAPGTSTTEQPASSQSGQAPADTAPATDVATTPQPDLPEPDIFTDTSKLAATPETDAAPAMPGADGALLDRTRSASLPNVDTDSQPPAQSATSLERSPDSFAGILTDDPSPGLDGTEDTAETTLDIYLASIERRDLAFDAIALPAPASLAPTGLPLVSEPPGADTVASGPKFVSVNPTVPVAPLIAEEPAPESADPATTTLRPTALAAALPSRAPRARPGNFTEEIERDQFGGRTRSELATIAPPRRPASAQTVALADRPAGEPTKLAVASSLVPRGRPEDFDALVATAVLQARAASVTASLDFETPDTSSAIEAALSDELEDEEPGTRPQDTPRLAIPSNASVSRQATVENAIRLNKINLVGVYGVPSDRRALIRLPNGRYVKVKVGDRVDGGTVAQIRDSELIYRKGSRTMSLEMPKG
ncbi:MAG: hypothetical protein HKP35_07815 [Silicimonas sp.]|nr:hypothetical protein [Silicimonas sp.]